MLASTEDESPNMPFNYMSDVNAKVAAATPASAETNSPPGEQTANTAVNVGEHTKTGDKMVKAASSTPKASSKVRNVSIKIVPSTARSGLIRKNTVQLKCRYSVTTYYTERVQQYIQP